MNRSKPEGCHIHCTADAAQSSHLVPGSPEFRMAQDNAPASGLSQEGQDEGQQGGWRTSSTADSQEARASLTAANKSARLCQGRGTGKFLPSRHAMLRGRLAHEGRISGGPETAEGYRG